MASAVRFRLLVLGAMLLPTACSGADDDRPPVVDFGETDKYEDVTPDAGEEVSDADEPLCLDGEERECSIYLPSHAGVVNCFRGVQVCEAGQWSKCGERKVDKQDTDPSTKAVDDAPDVSAEGDVYARDEYRDDPYVEEPEFDSETLPAAPAPAF